MGSVWRVSRKVRVVQRGSPLLQQLPPANAGPGAWKEGHSSPVPLPSMARILEATPAHHNIRLKNIYSKHTHSYLREPVAASCLHPPVMALRGYLHIPSNIQTVKRETAAEPLSWFGLHWLKKELKAFFSFSFFVFFTSCSSTQLFPCSELMSVILALDYKLHQI